MSSKQNLGGTFTLKGTSTKLSRLGYGAMQLTGPMVWGEPKDRKTAVAVVREAIALGVNHIDTSDFYGPHIANQIIREAIHPYPEDLVIVTKVGARRGADGSWRSTSSICGSARHTERMKHRLPDTWRRSRASRSRDSSAISASATSAAVSTWSHS